MAVSQFLLSLILLCCCFIALSSAAYTPQTSFVITTCNDATYSALCLETLLPDADRIGSVQKKSTRLAITAALSSVHAVSSNLSQLSYNPDLQNAEASTLADCSNSISATASTLNSALDTTDHLGGGDKDDKESKRMSMENDIKGVVGAVNSCLQNLQGVNLRDDVMTGVQAATQQLVQLATNAADLVRRMQF